MRNASRNLAAQEVARKLRGEKGEIPLEPIDVAIVDEFYQFLLGRGLPDGIRIKKGHRPKLSQKHASTIIWFLQEHLRIIPDHYECCDNCNSLYDSYCSGYHSEEGTDGMHFFCDSCEHLAPLEEETEI